MNWLKELSGLEWAAALVTLANVYLVARANTWNFAFGLLSVGLYSVILWNYKLYANFWLNVGYFLPMTLIGWWVWLRTGPQKHDDLPVRVQPLSVNLMWAAIAILAVFPINWLLKSVQGNSTIWDALTTTLSLVGQYYLTRKYAEQWLFWIVANAIYAFVLFPSQKLYVSAVLYGILLLMAVYGWIAWVRAAKKGAAHA